MLKTIAIILMLFISLPAMAETNLTPNHQSELPFNGQLDVNTHPLSDEMNKNTQNADSHGSGKAKAGLPQFDTSTFASQIFWLGIMFVVLYVFFSRVSLPKLSSAIESRTFTIKNDLEQAEKISDEADKARKDYEQALTHAHAQAKTNIIEIENALRIESEQRSSKFNKESINAIAQLESQAEKAKKDIQSDLSDIAKEMSQAIIQKLSDLNIDEKEIEKAIAHYLNDETSSTSSSQKAA